MAPDQIERETLIAAPVERVWALLTEAEHIGRWFADAGAEIDLRPGGALAMRWERDGTVRGAWRRSIPARASPTAGAPHRRRRRSRPRATRRWSSSRSSPRAKERACASSRAASRGWTRRRGRDDRPRRQRRRLAHELGELREYAAQVARLRPERRATRSSPRWPTRRAGACWTLIAERGEGTATTLAGELPVSRVAVVKHLAVLDRAGLVEGRRAGPRGPLHRRAPSSSPRPRAGWPARRRMGRAPGRDQAPGRGAGASAR